LASAKVLLIAFGSLAAFVLTVALPFYRKELVPAIDPSSLVKVKVEYNGDEGRNLWQNRTDGLIFAEGSGGFVLRVSNISDFELTLEDLLIKPTERVYPATRTGLWEGGWYYVSGADVLYESLYVDVCAGGVRTRRAFALGRIGENDDLARFRRVIHTIPPHETEYVLLTVGCSATRNEEHSPLRRAAILKFEPLFVLEGREFTVSLDSPVHVLEWYSTDFVADETGAPDLDPDSVYTHHDDE
jgi:hypothetical protein